MRIEAIIKHLKEPVEKPDNFNKYLAETFGGKVRQIAQNNLGTRIEQQTDNPYLSGAYLAANNVIINGDDGIKDHDNRQKTLEEVKSNLKNKLTKGTDWVGIARMAATHFVLTGEKGWIVDPEKKDEKYPSDDDHKQIIRELSRVMDNSLKYKNYFDAARYAGYYKLLTGKEKWNNEQKEAMVEVTRNNINKYSKSLEDPYSTDAISYEIATLRVLRASEIKAKPGGIEIVDPL